MDADDIDENQVGQRESTHVFNFTTQTNDLRLRVNSADKTKNLEKEKRTRTISAFKRLYSLRKKTNVLSIE